MNRVTQLICRSMLLLALVAASQLSLAQSPSAENPPTVPAPPAAPAAPAADALIDDTASAEEEDAQWMAVFLDGQRAGHVKNVRRVENGQVETSEEFLLRINRGGVTIEVLSEEGYLETTEGEPLGFYASQQISGAQMTIQGEIKDGRAFVTTVSAGSVQDQEFDWPEDAAMAERARLEGLAKGFEPGTYYEQTLFVPSSLQFVPATTRVEDNERVDLLGTEQDLVRVVETVTLGATPTVMTGWVTSDYEIKKARMSMMGLTFEAIACPESCATGDVEPADIFVQALVEVPERLSWKDRETPITFEFRATDPEQPLTFAESDEQALEKRDNLYRVTVTPLSLPTPPAASPAEGGDSNEMSDFRGATRWLQIDAPEIHELVRQARLDAQTPADLMQRMEQFVRDYVFDKNLSVGYATALEVARNRSGDCTEHALLLAAMGRAAGIPTRVATGLAYVEDWLGTQNVFVPHAWTQAWLDGRWVSFDAALGKFDAGHIALAYGDGDPAGFYDGITTLRNLEVVSVAKAD
ncbi:MAG: transglutaminase-like domain-containing protein [Pseudomonadota bacterium]